jgi:lysophospholipase L1-like esterase
MAKTHSRQRSSPTRRRLLISQGLMGSIADERLLAPSLAVEEPPHAVEAPPLGPPSPRYEPVRETAGLATVKRLLRGSAPLTWVFTGDHLAHGARYTRGARNFVEHFTERVRCELERHLDVVINTGVSGDLARRLHRNLEWRVLRFRADVVSVSLGMSDAKAGPAGRAAFRQHLRNVLDEIRMAGGVPLLHTPNAVYSPAVANRGDLPAYVEILREEAARVDLPLIDHWAHWGRLLPEPAQRLKWLADGRFQPGISGHRELAKLLFHELGLFDPASQTCRLEVL